MPDRTEDPEQTRVQWLLNRVREGVVEEAELEELALYAQENPALQGQLERGLAQRGLGAGWLDRVERDRNLQKIENAPWVRVERTVGLTLLLGGTMLGWLFSIWPGIVIGLGALILLVSVVRVRLKTHRQDPYRDVIQ